MLDLNTLRLVSALSFACFAFATVLLWRLVPEELGLKEWAKATILIFVALLLLGLRGFIPDFISITIANTIMTLGIGFLYIGTRNLINIRSNHQLHWLAAGFAFLICLSPNVSVRVVGTSILQLPYFAACAWLFWHSKDEYQIVVIKRISALIFALGSVMFISRIINPPSASTSSLYVNTHSWIEVTPYFYAIAFSMWLSLTLLLLVSIRLQNQRVAALAKAESINQALIESESYLRTILNKEPDCISVIDTAGNLIQINPAGLAMFEAESLAQLSSMELLNTVNSEFRADLIDMHKRVLAGESLQLEFEAVSLKGRHLWLHTNTVPMQANGKTVLLAVTRDITKQKIAEQTLMQSEKMYHSLFDTTSDAMLMLDDKGFFDGNKAALELFGLQAKEELLQYHPAQLSTPTQPCGMDSNILAENYINLAQQNGTAHFEWVHKRADTNEPFVADVLLSAFVMANKKVLQATVRDITARKKFEEQFWQLAFYDTLTKLPNRRLLNDRLSQLMVASRRTASYGALMFLDLDNFKPLNDTYGHEVGDMLLIEVASRIANCMREMDTVARFGGDEFVLLLGELSQDKSQVTSQATIVAEKVRAVLSEPYRFTIANSREIDLSIEHRCTGSIGVVVFNGNIDRQDDIIKLADTAMYEAKNAGRNQIKVCLS